MASDGTTQPELSESQGSSSKRRRTEQAPAEATASATDGFAKDTAFSVKDGVTEEVLRFTEGQQVAVNTSRRSNGFFWKAGNITKVWHLEGDQKIPYLVKLDDGREGSAPEDHDECIRLASRACRETRVLRLFALPEASQNAMKLRFQEGDRVAVQLDIGMWEEGGVIETWAAPEKNGKRFKTWAGVSVPYAVSLDVGNKVFVPFDSDDVIRSEAADLPPQKSIAEQIGGKYRTSAQCRFLERQNSDGKWVCVDTQTGVERPCAAPIEISDAAKSGDGTVQNVGVNMTGDFKCPDCCQTFDTEKAKVLHWKFIHDPNRHQED